MDNSDQLSILDFFLKPNDYYHFNKFRDALREGFLTYIKNNPGHTLVILMLSPILEALRNIGNGREISEEYSFGIELDNIETDTFTKHVSIRIVYCCVQVICSKFNYLDNRLTTLWRYELHVDGKEEIEEPLEEVNDFQDIIRLLSDRRAIFNIVKPYELALKSELNEYIRPKGNFISQETIERIRNFSEDRDWDQFHSPANLAKSIVIEAAELLECFQWDNDKFDLQHVKEELADVIIYSQNLLDKLELDADEIVNDKLDQNEAKYPVEKAKGKADKYDKLS